MSCPQLLQGHTPHDRLSFLINKLCAELESASEVVNPEINEIKVLAKQAQQVIDGYDEYIARMSSPHPKILDDMIKEGNQRDWEEVYQKGKTMYKLIPEMTAGGYEAVVLQQLARTSKARSVLEIGMFTGTTTLSLALLPSVEKVVALELEEYLESTNRPFFEEAKVSEKIEVRIGDALKSLEQLSQEKASFDMVFIDADKGNYTNYLRKVIDGQLLARGGFIVADNVAYKAAPWAPHATYKDGPVLDAFNETVRNDPELEVVMLPIEDGISLIRRRNE